MLRATASSLLAAIDAGARGLSYLDPRLAGTRLERDHVGAVDPGSLGIEVTALQLPVPGDAPVQDLPVQRGHHLNPARPVLRHELPGERRQVHPGHAHEPPALEARVAARSIPEAQLANHDRVARVVGMPIGEELDVAQPERLLALDTELEHEAVGQVDQVLVGNRTSAHDRRLPVIDAVGVGAGVVHLVDVLPLRRAPNAEVAVARRGQRLPQPLLARIEAAVCKHEAVGLVFLFG